MNTFPPAAVLAVEREVMSPLCAALSEWDAEENCSREAVFSALVERHARMMYRVAFSLLRNAADAEDAVQEALLKLYRSEAWRRMNDEKAFLAEQCGGWRSTAFRRGERDL